jgi:hypothetical protein
VEQNFFYITQGVYAIFGMIAFAAVTIFLVLLYRQVQNISGRLERIADKGVETAESAKNIFTGGEKLIAYSLYKYIKNINKSKKGEKDEHSCQ